MHFAINNTHPYLEKVGALPRSQTADILDQTLGVRMSNAPVYVHSNLIDTVDELTIKSVKQILLHHMLLRKELKKITPVAIVPRLLMQGFSFQPIIGMWG